MTVEGERRGIPLTRQYADPASVSMDSVEAAALARLHDYMRREPLAAERELEVARDAFVQGFRYGARWSVRATSALSNPEFREAIAILSDLTRVTGTPDHETEIGAGRRWADLQSDTEATDGDQVV